MSTEELRSEKVCPFCKRAVFIRARTCPHCQHVFVTEAPSTSIPPPPAYPPPPAVSTVYTTTTPPVVGPAVAGGGTPAAVERKLCPQCQQSAIMAAIQCSNCGYVFQSAPGAPAPTTVIHNVITTAPTQQPVMVVGNRRSRTTAILWALLLGGVGAHRFYLGQPALGIVYLLFCWTFIPAGIALFEILWLLLMSDAEFDRRYNSYLVRM